MQEEKSKFYQQTDMFPETLITKIKSVEKIHICDIVETALYCGRGSDHSYSDVEDYYVLFKTGGENPFMKELGKIFPFVYNEKKSKVVYPVFSKGNYVYPRLYFNLNYKRKDSERAQSAYKYMHKLIADAFVVNDNPEIKVIADHIDQNKMDYRPENIKWVTVSESNKNRTFK